MTNNDSFASGKTKWKVLIVDDDVGMIHALQRLLTLQRIYEVKVFNDASGVNREIEAWFPDLVIIDVKMRGIDGFEACRNIRSRPENDCIKIIAISGTVEEEDMKKMLEIGANAYFEKPFSNGALIEEIKRQLKIS